MTRLYTVPNLDARLNMPIVIDTETGLQKGAILSVFTNGNFEVLLSDSDTIALFNIFDPMVKVFI